MATPTSAPSAKTAATDPPPMNMTMTWDEFFAWVDEDTRAEWVNGEVIMMSPNSTRHQRVNKFLVLFLEMYFSENPLGEVLYAPLLMRLPEKPSGREPDLLVVLHENKDRLGETYLDGPADLVVEIVTEESQSRDRGDKFAEYEAAGIPEYWLIDPLRDHADFYHLGETGRYERIDLDAEGRFHSAVLPGLSIDPNWLWVEELPNAGEVIAMVQEMLAE